MYYAAVWQLAAVRVMDYKKDTIRYSPRGSPVIVVTSVGDALSTY